MAIESDVLVIGGGTAGLVAALSAAREGADVRLTSYKQSTLRMASGLVDVLGYVDGEAPVSDPFAAMGDLHADHPYSLLDEETIREGLSLFDEVVPEYHGAHTDANALVPTHGGTIKPTARYPPSVAPGVASAGGDALFVGFETVTDFDAPLAARHLEAAGVPFETAGVTLSFPGDLRDDAKVMRYARALDEDEAVTADGRRIGARQALAERVKPKLDGHERVGFPALLGDEDPGEVRSDLEENLGAAVFEVPMGPPSLPGMRLEDRLFDALDDVGVAIDTGNPIVGYEAATDGSVDHVLMDRTGNSVPYHAEQFVLATGGLVGKGINSDRDGVREPVFDCLVPQPTDRYDWFEDGVFDDHAFARFGVDVGADLRPRNVDATVRFDNLRAAGSVLGGYDLAAEKSGSGVSIATGHEAGRLAATEV
jgi:glycerol-3-phosphate dehydrogenase subunit B